MAMTGIVAAAIAVVPALPAHAASESIQIDPESKFQTIEG